MLRGGLRIRCVTDPPRPAASRVSSPGSHQGRRTPGGPTRRLHVLPIQPTLRHLGEVWAPPSPARSQRPLIKEAVAGSSFWLDPRGGGASTTRPLWELSPRPPHSLCLSATFLSPSSLPWQPDDGMSTKETEVQTDCRTKGSGQRQSYKLDLGLKVGVPSHLHKLASQLRVWCGRFLLPDPSRSAFFHPPCMEVV